MNDQFAFLDTIILIAAKNDIYLFDASEAVGLLSMPCFLKTQ